MATSDKFKVILEYVTKGLNEFGKGANVISKYGNTTQKATEGTQEFASRLNKTQKETRKVSSSFVNFQTRLGGIGKAFGNLRGMARTLSAGFGALIGAKIISEVVQLVNQAQQLTNKLRVVSTSTTDLKNRMSAMVGVARETRGDLDGTITMYQRLTFASNRLGASSEQVAQVTENLNKLMTIQGVQAHEARSILLQLSQGFQSGRLQGDEFRAISETLPPILDILAKETGRTREELKKLASEGFLKPRLILNALLKETANINTKFKKTSVTLSQGYNLIKTELLAFTATAGDLQMFKDLITVAFRGIALVIQILTGAISAVLIPLSFAYQLFIDLIKLNVGDFFARIGAAISGADFEQRKLNERMATFDTIAQQVGQTVQEVESIYNTLEDRFYSLTAVGKRVLNEFLDPLALYEAARLDPLLSELDSLSMMFSDTAKGQELVKTIELLGSISKETGANMQDIVRGVDKGKEAIAALAKDQKTLADINRQEGSFFEQFIDQNAKNELIMGYELAGEEVKHLRAITKEEFDGMTQEQQEALATTKESIVGLATFAAESNRLGVHNAQEEAITFANTWLFAYETTFRELQKGIKSVFGNFVDASAKAFGSAIMDGENFGASMKKVFKSFAKEMITALIKLAIQMMIIRSLAGMGVDTSEIKNLSDLGKKLADTFLKGGTSAAKGGVFRGGLNVPSFAGGGIVRRPTFAMIGDNPQRQEAVIPMQNGQVPVNLKGGGVQAIEQLNILPHANIDQALMDKPIEFWVALAQEKILPALNSLGQDGSTTSLAFQETR